MTTIVDYTGFEQEVPLRLDFEIHKNTLFDKEFGVQLLQSVLDFIDNDTPELNGKEYKTTNPRNFSVIDVSENPSEALQLQVFFMVDLDGEAE